MGRKDGSYPYIQERGERPSKQLPPSVTHAHHVQGTGTYCPQYHHEALRQEQSTRQLSSQICHHWNCGRSNLIQESAQPSEYSANENQTGPRNIVCNP